MMTPFTRYARITTKLPREFVLLQGEGCVWKRCRFCDYYTDVSDDPFAVNRPILDQVTGEYGVLDVINSGSAPELDAQTQQKILEIVRQKSIHTLWFESHYRYRDQLRDFAAKYSPARVKFRCGIETFCGPMRTWLQKGVPENVTAAELRRYFHGVCLLACFQGQTREMIRTDIETASRYFEYFSVNIFCDNTTSVRRDPALVRWFVDEIYPQWQGNPHVEILIENTDLGVGSECVPPQ